MKTPLIWRIRTMIIRIVKFFTGHEYGCCDDMFKRCSNCKYVKGEKKRNDSTGYESESEVKERDMMKWEEP